MYLFFQRTKQHEFTGNKQSFAGENICPARVFGMSGSLGGVGGRFFLLTALQAFFLLSSDFGCLVFEGVEGDFPPRKMQFVRFTFCPF